MKLDAHVQLDFLDDAKTLNVLVDADYVNADEEEIKNYIAEELNSILGKSISNDQFEVLNMEDLIQNLNYEEFADKTQYGDM